MDSGAGAPIKPRAPTGVRRILLGLLSTLHRWAESGWARSATFAYAFLNGAVLPGPGDALLGPLAVADPPRAYELAAWTIVGSTLGGLVAYAIGTFAFNELAPLLELMGMGAPQLERVRQAFEERGWMIIVAGSLPFLSTKIVSIAAGAFDYPFGRFALILLIVRAVRFLIIATICRFAGTGIELWLERKLGRRILTTRLRGAKSASRSGSMPANDSHGNPTVSSSE